MLTDDQLLKFREIGREARTRMEELQKDAAGDRQGAMRKLTELRKEFTDKAVALMTDDQKKTWKEMTGEPVEIQFPRRPNN